MMFKVIYLSALCVFTSCVGVISLRELDSEKHKDLRHAITFNELPKPVKEIALIKYPPSDSLFYINDDLTTEKIFLKDVNRSIDGGNSYENSFLKHGHHFKINGKRFYIGSSADPIIYFKKYLYYTKTFSVTTYPADSLEASQNFSLKTLRGAITYYKVDLSSWLE